MKNHTDTDIQRIHVLNEQARRWTAMNQARRDGKPYVPQTAGCIR